MRNSIGWAPGRSELASWGPIWTTTGTQRDSVAARSTSDQEATVAPESRWVPVVVQIGPEQASSLRPGAHPIEFRIRLVAHADAARDLRADLHEKSTFIVPR